MDGTVIGIIIALIAIGIGLAIGIPRAKKIRAMQNEGTIIRRDMHYAERGEQFTSRIGSYEALKAEIEKMKSPCSAEGNLKSEVRFTSASFNARLYRVDFDEASGVGVYRFEFTKWKTGRYTYVDEPYMNMLMTSVEKAFLNLDPNTGVASYDLKFKTAHSIF